MNRNNDSDMKIYVKKRESEQSDFDGLARSIDFHKENGNKQKAEDLGRELAKLKPTDSKLNISLSKEDRTSAILYQARVLITFLCGRAVRENIPSQILSDTVRNAMYDELKETETGYYKNIADGAAFSFYRLALKKDGDKAELIGREFAKLCSAQNDDALIKLGTEIYTNTLSYLKERISKSEFIY